jgi:hypothetical protein
LERPRRKRSGIINAHRGAPLNKTFGVIKGRGLRKRACLASFM